MLRFEGDNIRDYATSAFVKYARLGCPTRKEREEQIRCEIYKRHADKDPKCVVSLAEIELQRMRGHLDDVEAVNKTFEMLYGYTSTNDYQGTRNGVEIAEAVKGVYFTYGAEKLTRNTIALRVRAHAMSVPCDERTVYRWLKYARELFGVIRGLDIDTDDNVSVLGL